MTVRLIVFTLAALSLVNAYSFVKIYSSTSIPDGKIQAGPGSRMPSSIPPELKQALPEIKTWLAMDLNCGLNKKLTGLKVSGQWAQLKGRMCSSSKLKTVEITNLNNGFTASVFDQGGQDYQTDLIQLNQGSNKIRVRITPLKGSVEEQTIIIESQSI